MKTIQGFFICCTLMANVVGKYKVMMCNRFSMKCNFVGEMIHSKSNICATSSYLSYTRIGVAGPEVIKNLSDKSMCTCSF